MTSINLTWADIHERVYEISINHMEEFFDSSWTEINHRKSIYIFTEELKEQYTPIDAYSYLQNVTHINPINTNISKYMHWVDMYILVYYENIFRQKIPSITEEIVTTYNKSVYNFIENLKTITN